MNLECTSPTHHKMVEHSNVVSTIFFFRKSQDSSHITNYSTSIFDSSTIMPSWMHKNLMPNYFMSGRISSENWFSDSSLVFIHHPRSGGQNIIHCLNNISYSNDLAMSPLMTSENRLLWESRKSVSNTFRNKFKIHRGMYTVGMCQNLNQKCSYMILLRDPLQRSISSHKHCCKSPRDEICGLRDARETPLRDWIISEGNVLLKHFLLSPKFCEVDIIEKYNISIDITKHISCWTKSNLILDNLIKNYKTQVTNFIVENLHKFISVIGLTKEFDLSLKMFEASFKLPFSKCNFVNQERTRREKELNSNRALSGNRVHQTVDENLSSEEDDDYSFEDDLEIQEALFSDYEIFKEAKRIFHIQKQFLLNSVR